LHHFHGLGVGGKMAGNRQFLLGKRKSPPATVGLGEFQDA
jgi:hypothetical protein